MWPRNLAIWGPSLAATSLRVELKKTACKKQEQKRGESEPRAWDRSSPGPPLVRCLSPVSVGNLCLLLPALSLTSITKADTGLASFTLLL